MYIMAPEPISTVYFINPFPLIVAGQRLRKHVTAGTNTYNHIRTVGRVVFYTVRVVPRGESVGLFVYPLSLLGNGSLSFVPRQRRIVGDVVFYGVRIIKRE
jgi:hypothetical protein